MANADWTTPVYVGPQFVFKVTPGALWKMQRNGKYLVWQFYSDHPKDYDLKNLFQLFANFHHQSVHKATLNRLLSGLFLTSFSFMAFDTTSWDPTGEVLKRIEYKMKCTNLFSFIGCMFLGIT